MVSLALLCGLIGVFAAFTPWGAELESDLGLSILYSMRGTRPAPADVMVVSVDTLSAQQLNQSARPHKWDRRLHARLVDVLSQYGARVIAFDVFFDESRESDPEQDRHFAKALHRAGNVVLYADLHVSGNDLAHIEKLAPPTPELANAAAALAPYVLPKILARVDQFWPFKTSAGDKPILPVVAFQQFSLPYYESLYSLLISELPTDAEKLIPSPGDLTDISNLSRTLHEIFSVYPDLANNLLERISSSQSGQTAMLSAIVGMYGGKSSRYIDFYGPPHTINTVPFHSILNGDSDIKKMVKGKAVFIGGSEKTAAQQDDFYTVYRQQGIDLSGVEIAATIFGNLLENRSVKPLWWPYHLAVVFMWGIVISTVWFWFHPVLLAATIPLFSALLVGTSWFAFSSFSIWFPLAVPLLVQLPLILISVLSWRYLYTWREREKIRMALRRLLPEQVVTSIADGNNYEVENQTLFGVCMATDASRYTEISEQMAPEALQQYLNSYYQALFSPVRREQGFVSDVVGDAMMAIWTSTAQHMAHENDMRRSACTAALDIICQIDQFNCSGPGATLPTRIGLHCGPLSLGHVGAGDHYEYRAIGDTVNTASRIEGLNKLLGTSVLASAAVVETLDGILVRKVGNFLLKGKNSPHTIYELLCAKSDSQDNLRRRNNGFAVALQLFRERQWSTALARFEALLEQFRDDGPSIYYCALCQRCLQDSSEVNHDGVIIVREK